MSTLSHELPQLLYTADQVRQLDHHAIHVLGIPGITLMERAGEFAFSQLRLHWPKVGSIAMYCGVGNNGGDGYVVARLAKLAGYNVTVYQVGQQNKIKGDAQIAFTRMLESGVLPVAFSQSIQPSEELIVDGLLGTGLRGNVSEDWYAAIDHINNSHLPVLALDIPSGLNADSGSILGAAVRADITTTFVGLKQGLFTGDGPDCCGEIIFCGLEIPERAYENVPISATRLNVDLIKSSLGKRKKNSNKKHFGHVLVVGGDEGMSGAVRLAGESAARTGSGLVSLASIKSHVPYLNIHCPELMCHGVDSKEDLERLLEKVTVLIIGPGLGQSNWSRSMFNLISRSDIPVIVDADALNLLAITPNQRNNWILTPHPGEAARMLGCRTQEIQHNRFAAVVALQKMYHGVVVLKGNGTLIYDGKKSISLCNFGNPGMASGGMGDALSGIIGACVAQGLDLITAANTGVLIHACAGDYAAVDGQRGMLASDLIKNIRRVINEP